MTEKTLSPVEMEIQRTLDYRKIRNLIGRFAWKLEGGRPEEVVKLFAKKTPGVRVETEWGVYEGTAGVKKLYAGLYKSFMEDPSIEGQMYAHFYGSTDIVVAGDGKTAKGLWSCFGHETHPFSGKLRAYWAYSKRGFDFVKEDGQWKIWHYRLFPAYYTPYEKGWTEENKYPTYPNVDKFPPDKPASAQNKVAWIDGIFSPSPYETFDDKTAY